MTSAAEKEDPVSFWQQTGFRSWVAIDLETTGLDPEHDSIIELGAVRFEDGIAVESFSSLVNPGRKLPRFITNLTGIRDKDLRDAPRLVDIADDYIKFCSDLPLVGQNIGFDLGFLRAATPTSDHFHASRTIPNSHDNSLVARFVYPCLNGYGLSRLAQRFKIDQETCHRAADDAKATGKLFAHFMLQLSAVPLLQISRGIGFVEGTASPLLNSLRIVQKALQNGYKPAIPEPDALTDLTHGGRNTYMAHGSPRPGEPVSERQIQRFFNETERFRNVMPGYEVRPEQVEMSMQVARTFRSESALVIEAGTGVGKSLGYLAPALLSGGRVAISTHTKNLQDQLFFDEIPRLGELFRFGFTAALLKGRRNYLCRTKWKNLLIAPERFGSPAIREQLAFLTRWVDATKTGDTSEIGAVGGARSGGVLNLVASEPGYCSGRSCGQRNDCPLTKIRNAAQKADIVVVNHSLVLTDLYREAGIIGQVDRIIFDEAHHIEDVATDQFGSDLTAPGMRSALERVSHICRRGGELWTRLAADAGYEDALRDAEAISSKAGSALDAVGGMFDAAMNHFLSRLPEKMQYSESFRYRQTDRIRLILSEAGAYIMTGLTEISRGLRSIAEVFRSAEEDEFPAEVIQEFTAAHEELLSNLDALALSISADDSNRVYWVEIPPELNRPVRLRSAPLEVSTILAEGVWKRFRSVVLTSATLATSNDAQGFNHVRKRLGLELIEPVEVFSCQLGSPFNYDANCRVCYANFLPSPTEDAAQHIEMVAEICGEIALKLQRGMLILFTSYDAMNRVDSELTQVLQGSGIEVLVQGKQGNRERLVRRLRENKSGVLLGTDSLWEGIDIPGDALEIVVIPKLPFAVPSDPVIAARIDKLKDEGRNPFYEYQLPLAVLKTRQGAGRLIRTATDRGIVVVLDPRVLRMSYGRRFQRALPGGTSIANNLNELVQAANDFFNTDEKNVLNRKD